MREKVVLAYSGGLDTSIIIPWLKDHYNCEVIAFVADVGQGDDMDAVVAKAKKTGADKVIVKDLRQEFLEEYVFMALAPHLKIIAPWREWELKSREDCLDYAESKGIPLAQRREKIHSRD